MSEKQNPNIDDSRGHEHDASAAKAAGASHAAFRGVAGSPNGWRSAATIIVVLLWVA